MQSERFKIVKDAGRMAGRLSATKDFGPGVPTCDVAARDRTATGQGLKLTVCLGAPPETDIDRSIRPAVPVFDNQNFSTHYRAF
jgi:hypothetical protein